MPIRRRPTINATGLKVSAASTIGRTASGRNPFAAVVEACGQVAQAYTPENALRVVDWYEGMPELIEAIAGMLRAQGRKNTEEFFLYPAAGEFASTLGDKFLHYAGPCQDARAAFQAAHAEDLERIRNPKPHQAKWDLSLNAE